uniref:Putative pas domain-containing serine/threonine-protein kinase n=1 Tax=Culex tarsalis TaxID=7177 RepID=A0A1Q3EZR9_CULTA
MDRQSVKSSSSANNLRTPPAVSWKKFPPAATGTGAVEDDDDDEEDKENSLARDPKQKQLLLQRVACSTSKKRVLFRRHRPQAVGEEAKTPPPSTTRSDRNAAKGGLKPSSIFTPLNKLRTSQRGNSGTDSDWRSFFSNSFEVNQSFPEAGVVNRRVRRRDAGHLLNNTPFRFYRGPSEAPISVTRKRHQRSACLMDRVRVDGANGLRFTAFRPKGCLGTGVGSPYNNASYVASASESIGGRLPKTGINPNKAIFTIDAKSSQILIVNRNACELLGYSSKELCEMQFASLLPNKNKMHVSALSEGQLNSEDGTVIILSGKVVELCTKLGEHVAVSLWVRQIDNETRCLAVAEPVERRVAQLVVDKGGYVVSGDYEALMLFQLDSVEKFNGMDVTLLIPAIQLPDADSSMIAKHIRKQKATGKTAEGVAFPLCLMIAHHDSSADTGDSGLSNPNHLYVVTIWVFTNMSGLIVIDENSVIESCNHHFSMLMFGYSQQKIIGEPVTKILPNFGQECDYLGFMVRSRNATLSSLDNDESETETDHVDFESKDEFIHNAINSMKNAEPADVATSDSPVKESRKVCLDFTATSTGNNRTGAMSISLTDQRSADPPANSANEPGGLLSSIIVSSVPENLLYLESNSENNRNYANLSGSASCNAIKSAATTSVAPREGVLTKPPAMEDLVDCDLLTPVNDTSKSLMGNASEDNSSKEQLYSTEDINCALSRDYSAPLSAPPTVTTPRYIKPYELSKAMVTSTPDQQKRHSAAAVLPNLPPATTPQGGGGPRRSTIYTDGKYRGEAIHYDGNVIDVLYTISKQTLPCGRKVYCIWVSRDPESSYNDVLEEDEDRHQNLTLTFNSITSTVDNSLGQAIKNTAAAAGQHSTDRPASASRMSQCDDELTHGEYSKYYTLVRHIGKGAYGYVKLSYRNADRLLVISKFILKDKLVPQFMITGEDNREIPMEVYLLTHVKHPNIVNMFDWFENEKFFQVVMEIHGSGMDLFEFIDRRPVMTEKLGCLIFRQIANAVAFLHSLNILHRDIKDENVIIDHNFHIKLIDFGSATFVQEGQLFATFYGTTEYCSPEVLAGNRYSGPELEMWALGVTLYVLMFFENPFVDVEEILQSELIIPHEISEELEHVLLGLLDKNPKTRLTIGQLLEAEWMTQDINPAQFNFAKIIPCEPYETNPEKYYVDANVCSSQTGLSTSPHSLSMEGESMDGDEEHAHMDDSFLDDDECCPLSHDDDMPPDRCDDHPGNVLATGLTSLSLREPDGTCISLVDGCGGDGRMSQSAMGAIQQSAAGSQLPAALKEVAPDDDSSEILLVVLDDDEDEDGDGEEEDEGDDDDDSRLFRDDDLSRSSTHSNRLHGSPSKGARHRRQQRQSQQQQQQRRRRRAWETCVPKVVATTATAESSVTTEDYASESFEEDVEEEDSKQRHVS